MSPARRRKGGGRRRQQQRGSGYDAGVTLDERICAQCYASFLGSGYAVYCSTKCRVAAYRARLQAARLEDMPRALHVATGVPEHLCASVVAKFGADRPARVLEDLGYHFVGGGVKQWIRFEDEHV